MLPKLTKRMDAVIKLSQRIAQEYGQEYVGTEHLLLAILQEGSGLAVEILRDGGVDEPRARSAVDGLMRKSLEDTWVFGRLPGTPHFRNVMEAAINEAGQFRSPVVCTEFLLAALAREDGSVAQGALAEMGIEYDHIRKEIERRRGGPEEKRKTGTTAH